MKSNLIKLLNEPEKIVDLFLENLIKKNYIIKQNTKSFKSVHKLIEDFYKNKTNLDLYESGEDEYKITMNGIKFVLDNHVMS